ncbi:MAG: BlaI/MecI/CopY family transcriptional regulator [Planctomycetales bacterium]
MKSPEPLGQVQLEILQYIADHQPIRVGEVAEHFARTAGKARTTVLTVMERLREKGYLTRKRREGAYQYSLRLRQSEVLAGVVRRFVEKTLGGSVSPFLAYLADANELSDSELSKLKDLVHDIESRRDNGSRRS